MDNKKGGRSRPQLKALGRSLAAKTWPPNALQFGVASQVVLLVVFVLAIKTEHIESGVVL